MLTQAVTTVGDNNSGIVGNNNAMAENNANNSIEQRGNSRQRPWKLTLKESNNTVIQNADNSVTTYQGDNRSFIYNSTGGAQGQMYDTPGSMATLGGFL